MREKFEILAKVSGWSGTLNQLDNYSIDPEASGRLIEHVISVLERKDFACQELNRSLERQQLELEASREQVQVAASRLKEMRERLSASENQGIESTSRISSLSAQVAALEQGLKREKSQVSWQAEELQVTLDKFAAFRKEQSILTSELRSQAESSQLQAQEAQNRLHRVLKTLKEREGQISNFQEQVARLKEQLSTQEANFSREMSSTTRMAELYKNASEEAAERINLLQSEIEELRESLASTEAQQSGLTADLEAELEESRGIIVAKEEQLEKMRIALDGLLKVAKNSNSSAATNAGVDVAFDQTLFPQDHSLCQAKLAQIEEEASHLRINLQKLTNEMGARAPLIESLQIENSRLQSDVAALTEQLIQTASAQDSLTGFRVEMEKALVDLKGERDSLLQECQDLSQQVQRLLLELENLNSPAGVSNSKRQKGSSGPVLRASDVISDNFVDLTSVAQLQQRNQELLRALRGITAKYETLEREKESPQMKAQLEALMRELEEMREARCRQAHMVETILKTRNGGEITNSHHHQQQHQQQQQNSSVLSVELDQVKKQLESKQISLKAALTEVEAIKKDLTDERVAKARLAAQLELSEERGKMINETLQHERGEIKAIRERLAVQMDVFTQTQNASHKLMAELSSAQDREARLHAQIDKLQGELAAQVAEMTRLQREALNSGSERDRISSLLSSMQGVLGEHEASEATLKRHFTAQIEFMERELEASRARAAEAASMHASALNAVDRERSELFRRLEGLSRDFNAKTETNLKLENALEQSGEKIRELERVLQQAASESVHDENNVKTYELKLRALTSEVKALQGSLREAEQKSLALEAQLEEYKNLKSQLEYSQVELTSYAQKVQAIDSEIENLKGDKSRLEEELSQIHCRNAGLEEQINELKKEIDRQSVQIQAESSFRSQAESERAAMAEELKESHIKISGLEKELQLKNAEHEKLQEGLLTLEDRLRTLQEQNTLLLDEAQKNVANREASEGQKDELDGSSAESGVIRFLREEKDRLQVEKERLGSQVRLHQNRAEELQRVLDSERESVARQAADYARLLAQIEEMNAQRQQGALQQHEALQMKMKIAALESQIREKSGAVVPLQESLSQAQNQLDQLQESMNVLQADRDAWKSRFESAVNAASSSTSPLETELKQAKMQAEMFRQRALALTKNLAETRSAAQQEIESLRFEINGLKAKTEIITNNEDVEMDENTEEDGEEGEKEAVVVGEISGEENEMVSDVEEEEQEESSDNHQMKSEAEIEPQNETESQEDEQEEEDVVDVNHPIDEINDIEKQPEEPINNEILPSDEATSTSIEPIQPINNINEPSMPSSTTAATTVVPRKKIVSLAGIVGNSSFSSASSTAAPTPSTITTASGKKIVPITFPDPPAGKTNNNSSSAPSSPNKSKKMKKLGKNAKNNGGKNNNSNSGSN